MKNLYVSRFINTILMVLITALISGCTKPYGTTADPNNSYVNGVPNPPSTEAIPIINSFSPTIGLPNTVITIAGNNFNTVLANNKVTINGLPATVNAVTTREILVTTPANVTSGKIVLTSGTTVLTSTVNFTTQSGGTVSVFKDMGATYLRHITIDAFGSIFADDGSKSVYKITLGGDVSLFAGGPNSTIFKNLWGVAVDTQGKLYLPDAGAFNVFRVTPEQIAGVLAGNSTEGYFDAAGNAAKFAAPTGIAIDHAGNLYVNDNHRVRKISNTGLVTTLAGSGIDGSVDGPAATARFGNLEGIAIDAAGNIFVSDTKYLKLRKITPDGVVSTLAGNGTPGFADGPGATAQFNSPRSLAVDPAGNIFVADGDSSLPLFEIRMVNKLGVVTTFIKGTSNTGVISGPLGTATTNFPDGMTFDIAGNMYIMNTGANIISKVTFK